MDHITGGGVYEIVNTVNGNRYIGSSWKFLKRWRQHRLELDRGTHCTSHLQRAWSKYGSAAFLFRPLIICANRDLLVYEQIAINAYKPEYNVCQVAGSQLGTKRSAETREKNRLARLGRKDSPERRAANSASKKNRRITAEHRAKISAAKLGKKHSAERVAKNSLSHMGKTASLATRQKRSASLRAYWLKRKADSGSLHLQF